MPFGFFDLAKDPRPLRCHAVSPYRFVLEDGVAPAVQGPQLLALRKECLADNLEWAFEHTLWILFGQVRSRDVRFTLSSQVARHAVYSLIRGIIVHAPEAPDPRLSVAGRTLRHRR